MAGAGAGAGTGFLNNAGGRGEREPDQQKHGDDMAHETLLGMERMLHAAM